MADSKGDPRVLFVMNLVLSSVFAAVVVWALSLVGAVPLNWQTVAVVAVLLVVVTDRLIR